MKNDGKEFGKDWFDRFSIILLVVAVSGFVVIASMIAENLIAKP